MEAVNSDIKLSRYCLVGIIGSVKLKKLHGWQLTISQSVDLQRQLVGQVSRDHEVIVVSCFQVIGQRRVIIARTR